MLRFEWNALRPGDETLVHDDTTTMALLPGTVEIVDSQRGDFGVGIRVATAGGPSRIVWPSSKTVHRGAGARIGPCWRCQSLADQA